MKHSPVSKEGGASRVVHVTTVPTTFKFLRGQPSYLRNFGFETTVIASPGEYGHTFARQESVDYLTVPMERRITPLRDIMAIIRIVRHLLTIQPDIVHAHTPKGGLLGTIASWLVRAPVRIYHIRGLPFATQSGWKRWILKATERTSCKLATSVLAVSHSMRSIAVAEGLCHESKIHVIGAGSGNGVDVDHFQPDHFIDSAAQLRASLGIPGRSRVLAFVGRLVRDKGIYELAAAWSAISVKYPDVHLILAGPMEPESPLSAELLATLRQDKRIHLTGRIDDPGPVFAACDLLVLPTYREGFPNVVLEAAAMRIPVVATRIPGCVDAVQDGVTGILVPPRDSGALANAIGAILDNPDHARSMGMLAQQRVHSEFRPQMIWQGIRDVYLDALDRSCTYEGAR